MSPQVWVSEKWNRYGRKSTILNTYHLIEEFLFCLWKWLGHPLYKENSLGTVRYHM